MISKETVNFHLNWRFFTIKLFPYCFLRWKMKKIGWIRTFTRRFMKNASGNIFDWFRLNSTFTYTMTIGNNKATELLDFQKRCSLLVPILRKIPSNICWFLVFYFFDLNNTLALGHSEVELQYARSDTDDGAAVIVVIIISNFRPLILFDCK